MQTAEFDYNDFTDGAQNVQDQNLLVKFFYKSVQDTKQTAAEGHPVFVEREYVDIRVPGSTDIVVRPASTRDKERFPRHYSAFLNRVEAPTNGTPLTEWPVITRALADQLSFMNIKTVEALSELNDNLMGSLMGAQTLKKKAKDWLKRSKDDGAYAKLRDELTESHAKVEDLSAKLDTVLTRLDEYENEEGKPKSKKA